ncbi:MAG: SIS domain-containing protein, partial [Chloroflexi bacterium]|nr:SIS domain-containing protein [Chloroflexota bacterium]
QVEALGAAGDILWALTTSGNSPNVLAAVAEARRRGLRTIGFSGQTGGKLRDAVELCLCVQSTVTARIQEAHIAMAHIICDLIDAEVAAEEPGSPR